jgi:uncharacterized protein YidB (DUF937 family)
MRSPRRLGYRAISFFSGGELPQAVDKLTPQGRVPTPQEASQSV